jgi:GNAT superfamily N-acetyltransferase
MNPQYFSVGRERLDLLVAWRLDSIADAHPELSTAELAAIGEACKRFFAELFARDAYVGFFGKVGAEIVCTAGILVYDLPPYADPQARRVGHLLNVYTAPAQRRKGYARGLISHVSDYCRGRGFNRVVLNATELGRPLYAATGFREASDAMRLDF